MTTYKQPFFVEYLKDCDFLENTHDSKVMEKDHLIKYLLTFFENYSKSKDLQELPVECLCRYLQNKSANNRSLKKTATSLMNSLQHYYIQSSELAYYSDILSQQKCYAKEVTSYLRCRKAILEFFPGKLSLDDLVLSLDTWTTLLKRLRKDNTNEVLKKFKDWILESQQENQTRTTRAKNTIRPDKLEIYAMNFVKLYLNEFSPQSQLQAPEKPVAKKPLQEICVESNIVRSKTPTKSPLNTSKHSPHQVAKPVTKQAQKNVVTQRRDSRNKSPVETSLDLSCIKLGPNVIQSAKVDEAYLEEFADAAQLFEKINKTGGLMGKEQERKPSLGLLSVSRISQEFVTPVKDQRLEKSVNYANQSAFLGTFEDQLDRSIERLQKHPQPETTTEYQDFLVNKAFALLQKGTESREQENLKRIQEENEKRETEESWKVYQESLKHYKNLEYDYKNVYGFCGQMQSALINTIMPKLERNEPELFDLLDLKFIENYARCRNPEENQEHTNQGYQGEATNEFKQSIFMCDPELLDNARILSEKTMVYNRRPSRKSFESRDKENVTQAPVKSPVKKEYSSKQFDTERMLTEDMSRIAESLSTESDFIREENALKNVQMNKEYLNSFSSNRGKSTENLRRNEKSPLNHNSKMRINQNSKCPRSLAEELARHKRSKDQPTKEKEKRGKSKSPVPSGKSTSREAKPSSLSSLATSAMHSQRQVFDSELEDLKVKDSYRSGKSSKDIKVVNTKANTSTSPRPSSKKEQDVKKTEKTMGYLEMHVKNPKNEVKGNGQSAESEKYRLESATEKSIFSTMQTNKKEETETLQQSDTQYTSLQTHAVPENYSSNLEVKTGQKSELSSCSRIFRTSEDIRPHSVSPNKVQDNDGPNFGMNVFSQKLEQLRNRRNELESRSLLVRSSSSKAAREVKETEQKDEDRGRPSPSRIDFINQYRSNSSEASRDLVPREHNFFSLVKDIREMISYSSVGGNSNVDARDSNFQSVDKYTKNDNVDVSREERDTGLERVPEVNNQELELETARRQQQEVQLENYWSFQGTNEESKQEIEEKKLVVEQEREVNELEKLELAQADEYLIYDTRDLEDHFVNSNDVDLGTDLWMQNRQKNEELLEDEYRREEDNTSQQKTLADLVKGMPSQGLSSSNRMFDTGIKEAEESKYFGSCENYTSFNPQDSQKIESTSSRFGANPKMSSARNNETNNFEDIDSEGNRSFQRDTFTKRSEGIKEGLSSTQSMMVDKHDELFKSTSMAPEEPKKVNAESPKGFEEEQLFSQDALKKTFSAPKFKIPNLLSKRSYSNVGLSSESGRSSSVFDRRQSTTRINDDNNDTARDKSPASAKLRKPSFANRIKSIARDSSAQDLRRDSFVDNEDSLFEPSMESYEHSGRDFETERQSSFRPEQMFSKQRSSSLISIHKTFEQKE